MTPEQIQLVQRSWDSMSPVWKELAGHVYARLFELAPGARKLFPADLEPLKLKLMDTLTVVIGHIDNPVMFRSIVNHSGRQHGRFGAKPEHFAAFREALMDGMSQQFGEKFTPELREAWLVLYSGVETEMLRGMRLAT